MGAIALISLAEHRSKKPLSVQFSDFAGTSAMKIVSGSGEMGAIVYAFLRKERLFVQFADSIRAN